MISAFPREKNASAMTQMILRYPAGSIIRECQVGGRNLQPRAKSSLARAIKKYELVTGQLQSKDEGYPAWTGVSDACETDVSSES
jgi:hypothetical protein